MPKLEDYPIWFREIMETQWIQDGTRKLEVHYTQNDMRVVDKGRSTTPISFVDIMKTKNMTLVELMEEYGVEEEVD